MKKYPFGIAAHERKDEGIPMDFYQKMALVCKRIPSGCVATYGQIALLCGKPNNSRQVGYGLKCGLAGEDIPAHRIVNAKGILSGAAYFDTIDMQKMLLEAEGVIVKRTALGWQVDLKRFGWKNTLEDAADRQIPCESLEGISLPAASSRD